MLFVTDFFKMIIFPLQVDNIKYCGDMYCTPKKTAAIESEIKFDLIRINIFKIIIFNIMDWFICYTASFSG